MMMPMGMSLILLYEELNREAAAKGVIHRQASRKFSTHNTIGYSLLRFHRRIRDTDRHAAQRRSGNPVATVVSFGA